MWKRQIYNQYMYAILHMKPFSGNKDSIEMLFWSKQFSGAVINSDLDL